MPMKAKRSCMAPGCSATYDGPGGYCPLHKPIHDANKTYNTYSRDKDRQAFESSSRWRKIRHAYLAKHPLCEDCLAMEEKRITQAQEVHHRDNDYNNNDDMNLMALCCSCHSIRTRKGE
jgi:5-methylcytosine-specific restriction protein A